MMMTGAGGRSKCVERSCACRHDFTVCRRVCSEPPTPTPHLLLLLLLMWSLCFGTRRDSDEQQESCSKLTLCSRGGGHSCIAGC